MWLHSQRSSDKRNMQDFPYSFRQIFNIHALTRTMSKAVSEPMVWEIEWKNGAREWEGMYISFTNIFKYLHFHSMCGGIVGWAAATAAAAIAAATVHFHSLREPVSDIGLCECRARGRQKQKQNQSDTQIYAVYE